MFGKDVKHGGRRCQPAVATGTGQDVDAEHTRQQLSPGEFRGRDWALGQDCPVDGGQTLFSICDSDYGPAMAALSSAIIGRVETD